MHRKVKVGLSARLTQISCLPLDSKHTDKKTINILKNMVNEKTSRVKQANFIHLVTGMDLQRKTSAGNLQSS